MIEDGRNPRDEARRRSQNEGDADEEEEGKGGYLYGLGDCQLDGLRQERWTNPASEATKQIS